MSRFDRFAAWCSYRVAQAPFFVACVLLVAIWVPTLFVLSVDTSQLIINTATTIITFLMVALLQNSQQQDVNAIHHKLDRLAESLDAVDGVDRDKLTELIGSENRIGA